MINDSISLSLQKRDQIIAIQNASKPHDLYTYKHTHGHTHMDTHTYTHRARTAQRNEKNKKCIMNDDIQHSRH